MKSKILFLTSVFATAMFLLTFSFAVPLWIINTNSTTPASPATYSPSANYSFQINFTEPNGAMANATFQLGRPSGSLTNYTDNTTGLVGYWRLNAVNGTNYTLDSSGYENDGQLVNFPCSPATCNLTAGKYGNGLLFDGVNDYVDAGNGASLNIVGSITLEAWIKPNSVVSTYFISKYRAVNNKRGYELAVGSGKIEFGLGNETDASRILTSSTSISTNNWYHVVGVKGSDNIMKIYINGVQDANTLTFTGSQQSTTINLQLGAYGDSVLRTGYFNGTIDEVRIYNRSLSADEIKMQYDMQYPYYAGTDDSLNGTWAINFTQTAFGGAGAYNYTWFATNTTGSQNSTQTVGYNITKAIPTITMSNTTDSINTSGLVGYWSFSEGSGSTITEDKSGWGNNSTLTNMNTTGNSTSGWTAGKYGSGLQFDGVNDYVNVGNTASLNITGAITVSAWVKKNNNATSNRGIVGRWWNYGSSLNKRSFDLTENSSGYLGFGVSNDGTASIINTTTGITQSQINTWYHVVGVYMPSTSLSIYVNGVLENQVTSGIIGSIYASSEPVRVGVTFDPTVQSRYFNGTIDEVRIYNRSLSADEIKMQFNSSKYYPYASNVSASINNAEQTATLYRYENTSISGTFDNQILGAGQYWYIANASSTENYTKAETLLPFEISPATPYANITFSANNTIYAGDNWDNNTAYMNFSAANPLNWTAYRNSTLIDNTSGLVGRWGFDELSGSAIASDSSGFNNTGTLTNMNTSGNATSGWASGKYGSGLNFDGLNDYVNASNASIFNFGKDDFSISMWVKTGIISDIGTYGLISKSTDAANEDATIYIASGKVVAFDIWNTSITDSAQGTKTLNDNTWYHIAGVRNATNLVLYIDGIINKTAINRIINSNNIGSLKIGVDQTYYFDGTIDEVRIYNRSLSADEIAELYLAGANRLGAGIYNYTLNTSGNQNYSAASFSTLLNISQNSTNMLQLWFNNGTQYLNQNISATYPTQTNATGTQNYFGNAPAISLYYNNQSTAWNNTLITLGAEQHEYALNTSGNANYSENSLRYWINITYNTSFPSAFSANDSYINMNETVTLNISFPSGATLNAEIQTPKSLINRTLWYENSFYILKVNKTWLGDLQANVSKFINITNIFIGGNYTQNKNSTTLNFSYATTQLTGVSVSPSPVTNNTGQTASFTAYFNDTEGNALANAACNVTLGTYQYAMNYLSGSYSAAVTTAVYNDNVYNYNITCANNSYQTRENATEWLQIKYSAGGSIGGGGGGGGGSGVPVVGSNITLKNISYAGFYVTPNNITLKAYAGQLVSGKIDITNLMNKSLIFSIYTVKSFDGSSEWITFNFGQDSLAKFDNIELRNKTAEYSGSTAMYYDIRIPSNITKTTYIFDIFIENRENGKYEKIPVVLEIVEKSDILAVLNALPMSVLDANFRLPKPVLGIEYVPIGKIFIIVSAFLIVGGFLMWVYRKTWKNEKRRY